MLLFQLLEWSSVYFFFCSFIFVQWAVNGFPTYICVYIYRYAWAEASAVSSTYKYIHRSSYIAAVQTLPHPLYAYIYYIYMYAYCFARTEAALCSLIYSYIYIYMKKIPSTAQPTLWFHAFIHVPLYIYISSNKNGWPI